MLARALVLLLMQASAAEEFALINLIRHGERNNNESDPHLTREGEHRAMYIARCIGAMEHTTMAFPLGKPSRLLASLRPGGLGGGGKASHRPAETLQPLADEMNLPLDTMHFADYDEFHNYVHNIEPGSTILVSWQHKKISRLVALFDPGGLAPDRWPYECNFTQWSEPSYTTEDAVDNCYDLVWQLVLWRTSSTGHWRTRVFSTMHMGFGGNPDAPCESAFKPHSNPTSWEHAMKHPSTPLPSAALAQPLSFAESAADAQHVHTIPSTSLVSAENDASRMHSLPAHPPPSFGSAAFAAFVAGVFTTVVAMRLAPPARRWVVGSGLVVAHDGAGRTELLYRAF